MNDKLPKTYKLKQHSRIRQILRSSNKIKSHFFALFFMHNNFFHPRLAIVISKRNVKLSVARNRVKRIVRESFRKNSGYLGNYDIVFVAYRGIDEIPNKEFLQCLKEKWQKFAAYQENL